MAKSDGQAIDPHLPGMSNEAMLSATGKGWSEWVEVINAWPGSKEGHTAVAAWVSENYPVDGWWAQGITVGWERLTGRRQLHQQADGTFSASSSRTIAIAFSDVKQALFDDSRRDSFLGLEGTSVISRATSKSVRVKLGESVVLFDSYPHPDGRTRLSVTHEKLARFDDVETWKTFWSAWLAALPET